jgi:hypothetical protein
MLCLLQAATSTILMMIYEKCYSKTKVSPTKYICLFAFLWASGLFFDHLFFENKLHATESYELYVLTPAQRQYYEHEMNWHYNEAGKYVLDADSIVSSIRDKTLQTASKTITHGIATLIVSRNITVAAGAASIVALEDLIGHLNEIWTLTSYAMHDAQCNVELAIFYKAVLDNDGK